MIARAHNQLVEQQACLQQTGVAGGMCATAP
jgi:hypothetical protein